MNFNGVKLDRATLKVLTLSLPEADKMISTSI